MARVTWKVPLQVGEATAGGRQTDTKYRENLGMESLLSRYLEGNGVWGRREAEAASSEETESERHRRSACLSGKGRLDWEWEELVS